MSSSSPSRTSHEKPWFQDWESGCEKQTTYFVRIRKLQEELINREQHNLINAMERLKQVTYPRKKPFVRQFGTALRVSQSFPARPMNARRDLLRRPAPNGKQTELKPLRGKHIVTHSDATRELSSREMDVSFTISELRRLYRMMPMLNDNQIAKIVCNASSTFPNEPSTYLLQPHLPSIPNSRRKTTIRLDNRLKLLSLAGEPGYIEDSPATKRIQNTCSVPQRGEKGVLNIDAKLSDGKDSQSCVSKHKRKQKRNNMLAFDVDPNDPTVFVHSVKDDNKDTHDGWKDYVDIVTPLPPPNSRPSSVKSKSNHPLYGRHTIGVLQESTCNKKDEKTNNHNPAVNLWEATAGNETLQNTISNKSKLVCGKETVLHGSKVLKGSDRISEKSAEGNAQTENSDKMYAQILETRDVVDISEDQSKVL